MDIQFEQTGHLNNDFRTGLHHLMEHGITANPRGTVTKELLNYNITLSDARNRVITFKSRNTNTRYLLGELIWYVNGSNTLDGILPYSKFWANITNSGDHDGYEKGTVNSNYGNRLLGKSMLPSLTEYTGVVPVEPINQWAETISLLAKDKDTRQAILNIHLPSDRHIGNKDVPCTLSLQFLIRENKLHLIVNMRSNDIILGFTNDVFQFTMLQEIMQVQLKETYPDLELGHYFHNAGSMHIYSRHFDMAENILNEDAYDLTMIPMDAFNYDIMQALVQFEETFRNLEDVEALDIEKFPCWEALTPYWQTLVKALFLKDEEAMHDMFGMKDDE